MGVIKKILYLAIFVSLFSIPYLSQPIVLGGEEGYYIYPSLFNKKIYTEIEFDKFPLANLIFLFINKISPSSTFITMTRFFAVITVFISSLFVFFTIKKLKDVNIAFITSLFFSIMLLHPYSNVIWGEIGPYCSLLFTASMFVYYRFDDDWKFFLIGVVSSITFLIQQTGITILIISLILILLQVRQQSKSDKLKKIFILFLKSILGFSIPILITFIFYSSIFDLIMQQAIFSWVTKATGTGQSIFSINPIYGTLWKTYLIMVAISDVPIFYVLAMVGIGKDILNHKDYTKYVWLCILIVFTYLVPKFNPGTGLLFISIPFCLFVDFPNIRGKDIKTKFKNIMKEPYSIITILLFLITVTTFYHSYREIEANEITYKEIGKYIQEHSSPNDKILLMNTSRGQIYFYSNRESSVSCYTSTVLCENNKDWGNPKYIIGFLSGQIPEKEFGAFKVYRWGK